MRQLRMVRQEGFEPPTYCLEGSCSIRVSYWRVLERVMGIEPTPTAWKAVVLAVILHPRSSISYQLFNFITAVSNCQELFSHISEVFAALP